MTPLSSNSFIRRPTEAEEMFGALISSDFVNAAFDNKNEVKAPSLTFLIRTLRTASFPALAGDTRSRFLAIAND